jgi:RIO-like serine/threonine protein kinase
LLDLQQVLDSGVIIPEVYDELRKKIIMEKLDTLVDSKDTDSLSRKMEILINTIQTYG